ncbi:MAG: hypothetical protein ACLFPI_08455, partial [Desulfobacterales bacterium]
DKETVMGRELDELIRQMRPGIRLPSDPSDEQAAKAEDKTADAEPGPDADAENAGSKESADETL